MVPETTGWLEVAEQCDVDLYGNDSNIKSYIIPVHVVIHIDGACRRNGTQYARGGLGVFFGPGSQNNTWGLLPPNTPQTSTYADLYALIVALELIRDELPLYLERVFVVSDSSYLVRAFAKYMSVWLQNGGINSRGRRVAHWNFMLEIKHVIDDFTWSGGRDMELIFCHAPRELNEAADALANRALN
ncbi:ribonuclease H1 [Fusarium bulbicola]|nr:ribonuclease H1 [Fusarium bulbicola]